MASCISILDWYHNDELSLEEFLSKLFDLAVTEYGSQVHITNDCIKTAQVGTFMKRNIKDAITKYLVQKDKYESISFFPINLYLLNPDTEGLSVIDRIQQEIESDIYYNLLSSVSAANKDVFIGICLDWEKTFLTVWRERVEEVNSDFKQAIQNINI
ncbi:hypothetical protein [Bacillus wiedmannii]|uniref:hypothetical protein n=1 Tax=Bacillus wiedmannii TaxID=1890302 RepID=UPI0007CACB7F|nr:hypothetical protein [Bacillus wiedmannii]OAK35901.1 hypothetical protein A6284_26600 [Bacillus wiedmannii]HDR7640796.1 hypothetical protein [Bacillus wiedmannii]